MEGYRPSSCVFSGPAPSVIARILPTASSEHIKHVEVSGADQAPAGPLSTRCCDGAPQITAGSATGRRVPPLRFDRATETRDKACRTRGRALSVTPWTGFVQQMEGA